MYNEEIREMTESRQNIKLTSIQIQALVRDMDTSMRKHRKLKARDEKLYHDTVATENQVLYNVLPTVFDMHLGGRLDQQFFEMLKLRRKIETGEMTDDQASRLIGQGLFDRYVAPIVNKTDHPAKPMSYEEFYKQFDKK
jgi:hypothetical protein